MPLLKVDLLISQQAAIYENRHLNFFFILLWCPIMFEMLSRFAHPSVKHDMSSHIIDASNQIVTFQGCLLTWGNKMLKCSMRTKRNKSKY